MSCQRLAQLREQQLALQGAVERKRRQLTIIMHASPPSCILYSIPQETQHDANDVK